MHGRLLAQGTGESPMRLRPWSVRPPSCHSFRIWRPQALNLSKNVKFYETYFQMGPIEGLLRPGLCCCRWIHGNLLCDRFTCKPYCNLWHGLQISNPLVVPLEGQMDSNDRLPRQPFCPLLLHFQQVPGSNRAVNDARRESCDGGPEALGGGH